MTVVPVAFQLTSWIPAWWRGEVGGDDLVSLLPGVDLPTLLATRDSTVRITAYCPALGVAVLPGPKPATEAAVAAAQAVIFHAQPGMPGHLLIPDGTDWRMYDAAPSRPVALDPEQAKADLAQAVVRAEQDLRSAAISFGLEPRPATARPLPPGASGPRRALLTRAVRLWTALDAVPRAERTDSLTNALTAAATATLAAYLEPEVRTRQGRPADRRPA
jgi:hypothetical protein